MERITAGAQGFRPVPRTGVIYVMTEAARHGYVAGDKSWANLGQGAPETGPLPNAPKRLSALEFSTGDHEYAPIDGLPELKQAVADLYNQRYRQGKKSQYTKENVSIAPGGRAAITRLISTVGRTNVGHFLPDYTAYEELLDAFGTFVPIPILLNPDRAYAFSSERLEEEVLGRGLSAVLLSNPCNPTGRLIQGPELEQWVKISRSLSCTLIVDEFYSHYIYESGRLSVSAADYVDDVDKDPVVIVDGLTKNWRYPGFRVSWTVGPRSIIEAVASAGSFLDGGCSRPMQIAATQLVRRDVADTEAHAIQEAFSRKRQLLLSALADLNIRVNPQPQGGFYCWSDLSELPEALRSGMKFFRAALEHKVIVVPGVFFDINPGHRRPNRQSRFENYARFSFGPSEAEIIRGMDNLRTFVRAN